MTPNKKKSNKKINTSINTEDQIKNAEVIIDVIPVYSSITASSLLWPASEYFNGVKKELGKYSKLEVDNKTYIAIYCCMVEEAPSGTIYTDSKGKRIIDNHSSRLNIFSKVLSELESMLKDKEILSRAFLTGIFKETIQKHKTDIEYFLDNIYTLIPYELKWTIQHPKKRYNKHSNNQKIKVKDEFYTEI